ncbi:ATP cone domain-containing protein [Deinococcus yavapaiensis]|uniref:2-phosphoglycerate kinase n=1 Tax=Deinococcus yavapaiensis KR-236 TaxID=694435 RepID=A0A318SA57_9DEIO|nr:ATP cone domain-containing protein [Deinococcus yavapaiensis]PYE55268.1 2-phosphoglycerate kinase [Deinococcus yavapaiensis KR-236]
MREIYVGRDGHRWPFSKGLVIESLLNADIAPEPGAAVARSVEQHLLDHDLRLVSPEQLQGILVTFVREELGDVYADRVAAQTPTFHDIAVTGGAGTLPFSRGVLARSLEDVGLAPREAFAVASRVDRVLRQGGVRHVTADELGTITEETLANTLGESWRHTYRFLRHHRGRLGVVDEGGVIVPFSKGILAQSLLAAGLSHDHARKVARETQQRLRAKDPGDRRTVTREHLTNVVEDILRREVGEDAAVRYHLLRALRRPGRPIVLLLGGVSGTGKSFLASEIAYRLGIPRIVSTDSVRQVMRAMVPPSLLPTLHASTFNAWEALLEPGEPTPAHPTRDLLIAGFREQVAQVSVGLKAVIERSIEEGMSVVVEGVHVAPGYLMAEPFPGALVVPILVTVPDVDEHHRHFEARDAAPGARRMSRYVRYFEEIRMLQAYLLDLAARTDVPTLPSASLDVAADHAVDIVTQRVLTMLEEDPLPSAAEPSA